MAGITTRTTGLAGQQQAGSPTPMAMPISASSSASLALSARVTVLRRAMSDLAGQLLHAVATGIEEISHEPAHLHL